MVNPCRAQTVLVQTWEDEEAPQSREQTRRSDHVWKVLQKPELQLITGAHVLPTNPPDSSDMWFCCSCFLFITTVSCSVVGIFIFSPCHQFVADLCITDDCTCSQSGISSESSMESPAGPWWPVAFYLYRNVFIHPRGGFLYLCIMDRPRRCCGRRGWRTSGLFWSSIRWTASSWSWSSPLRKLSTTCRRSWNRWSSQEPTLLLYLNPLHMPEGSQ